MTPEETITTLELAISEVEWNYSLDISIALETAIEALKKQIARKSVKETLKITDLQDFYCPSCKKKNNFKSGRRMAFRKITKIL